MSPDPGKDFDQNMNQLVRLLKKIIKGLPFHPSAQQPFGAKNNTSSPKEPGVNINFCFFNFLPITDEEIEEMDAMYDQFLADEEKSAELSPELNPSDVEFLRRNGIRF